MDQTRYPIVVAQYVIAFFLMFLSTFLRTIWTYLPSFVLNQSIIFLFVWAFTHSLTCIVSTDPCSFLIFDRIKIYLYRLIFIEAIFFSLQPFALVIIICSHIVMSFCFFLIRKICTIFEIVRLYIFWTNYPIGWFISDWVFIMFLSDQLVIVPILLGVGEPWLYFRGT